MSDQHDHDHDELDDDGAAPKTLSGSGYRSLNPLVYFGAFAIMAVVAGMVLWSVVVRPSAASATGAPPIVAKLDAQDTRSVLPDPTATPLGVPRTRPLFAMTSPAPKRSADSTSVSATQTTYVPAAPPPAAVPVQPAQPPVPRVKTDAELAADTRAHGIDAAARGSSRMSLESQDAQAQRDLGGASAPNESRGMREPVRASESTAFAGDAHAAFSDRHSGEPGYISEASRYELSAGTIIPCRLITTIDSTILGGVIEAQVVESVFDSATHQVVVIPAGTIAIGHADSALYGEARLAASWNEFKFQNGRKFFASSNEGAGMHGEAGMPSTVDTHAGRAFGNALVGAVLQAGVHLASRANSLEINSGAVTQAQPQRPTLHAYTGQLFNIVLEHDLPLDRYVDR
ncbi:MAG: TrbI/VirB10 family protein [Candidatus Velthaea sp.]